MGRLGGQPLKTHSARLHPLNSKFPSGTVGECIANDPGVLPVFLNQQDIVYLVECIRSHRFGPRN